jgi:hypothetical protein
MMKTRVSRVPCFLAVVLLFLFICAGSVAADSEPPSVIAARPGQGERDVPTWRTSCIITFSKAVTAGPGLGRIQVLSPDGEIRCVDSRVSETELQIFFGQHGELIPNARYTVAVPADAVLDGEGNTTDSEYTLVFHTGADNTPPQIDVILPQNGKKGFPVFDQSKFNHILGATFSEAVEPGSAFEDISVRDASGQAVPVDKIIESVRYRHGTCGEELWAHCLFVRPKQPLSYETGYTLTIPKGAVRDKAGNALPVGASTSFVTAQKQWLQVKSSTPAHNAVNVSLVNNGFKVFFSEHVLDGPHYDGIYITDNRGEKYTCLEKNLEGNTLTVKANHVFINYPAQTTYTLHLPQLSLTNNDRDSLDKDYALAFTTTTDQLAPFICYHTFDGMNMLGRVDFRAASLLLYTNEPVSLNTSGQYVFLRDQQNQEIPLDIALDDGDINRTCLACMKKYPWIGSRIRVIPQRKLEPLSSYTYVVKSGFVRDRAGNSLNKTEEFSFTTLYANERPGYYDVNKDPPEMPPPLTHEEMEAERTRDAQDDTEPKPAPTDTENPLPAEQAEGEVDPKAQGTVTLSMDPILALRSNPGRVTLFFLGSAGLLTAGVLIVKKKYNH